MAEISKKDLYIVGVGAPLVLGLTIGLGIVGAAWVKSVGTGRDQPRPTPPTFSLAALIPEADTRVKVHAFYRDMAVAVASPEVRTLEQFRNAQQSAVKILQASVAFPSVPAEANAAISKRLEEAVGLEPGELTAEKRAALVGACKGISAELLPDA